MIIILPFGKLLIYNNTLYMGDSNNTPQQVVGGNRSKTEIARFTSTTTWTCPQNVTNVDVWVCGGGGGGASGEYDSSAFGRCGAGGCGGECIMYRNIDVTPNQSYNIVIGVGGTGGTAATVGNNGNNGMNGGQSYFNNTIYNAKGGSGGNFFGNSVYSYIGTGMGGDGGGYTNKSKNDAIAGTYQYVQYLGTSGSFSRADAFNWSMSPVEGSGNSSAGYKFSLILNQVSGIGSSRIDDVENMTVLSGLNPYDGYHYGIGGSGAPSPILYFDPSEYMAAWSGNMHGGYPNTMLYNNPDKEYIHGSVTCGGGGSAGSDHNNYPHAGGNGGSGLIIIYG